MGIKYRQFFERGPNYFFYKTFIFKMASKNQMTSFSNFGFEVWSKPPLTPLAIYFQYPRMDRFRDPGTGQSGDRHGTFRNMFRIENVNP
jgi:hypothetical protein